MSDNRNVPEIRFEGFSDEWEEYCLGSIAESFEYGLNAAAIEYDGINKYIRITDINDETREFNIGRLTSPDTDLSVAENYKLKKSDLLFARTGASVGKTYHYKESDGLVYYAGFLIRARIKAEFSIGFVFQKTLTHSFYRFIKLMSQRSGQPGINAKEYSLFKIMTPEYPEQSQIGSYFQNLDKLITQHQNKHNQLVNLKKAMLEKMFPKEGSNVPEIRFKGFSDKWKDKTLEDVADLLTGKPFESKKFVKHGVFLMRGINVKRGYVDMSDGISAYWPTSIGLSNYLLQKDDILIQMDGALIGKSYAQVESVSLPALLVQRVTRIRSGSAHCHFIYPYIQRDFLKYIEGNKTETAVPHLSLNDIKTFKIKITSNEEQQKIGFYFQNLDKLIALQKQQLEKLKNLKKACLDKMFV